MIKGAYTIFTRIPLFIDEKGCLYTDILWQKDLELHFNYIDNIFLCCPVLPLEMAPQEIAAIHRIGIEKVFSIRKDGGWLSVASNFIPNFYTVATALWRTTTAHSDGAGWAFPLSFYIVCLRPFINFKWIVVIESSFWMKDSRNKFSLRQWVSHHLHHKVLSFALRQADVRIFTHSGYQKLFNIGNERSLVYPAIWVDEERILSPENNEKRVLGLGNDKIRFLFPARLTADKGVYTVIKAVEILKNSYNFHDREIIVDVIGEGPLSFECERLYIEDNAKIKFRYLRPVPYGDQFFDIIRCYHAVLLANRKEEQPRVIFDAFSQGVPVISSDTSGVRDVVVENVNALLFPIDDAEQLAKQMLYFSDDSGLRLDLSRSALVSVKGNSHSKMHEIRGHFLQNILGHDG